MTVLGPLPRPVPIHVHANAFAFQTMSERVPGILRDVIDAHPAFPATIRAALEGLRTALIEGEPVPLPEALPAPPPDAAGWEAAYRAQATALQPMTWLHGEWFFLETYLYRLLIEAVRWFESGLDPFAYKKDSELESDRLWTFVESTQALTGDRAAQLADLLLFALWGNRADLSHGANQHADRAADDADLLIDDRAAVLRHLRGASRPLDGDAGYAPGAYHIIADNAGVELAGDLALTDLLLRGGATTVTLHLKWHPTFVSDATLHDVWKLLAAMEAYGGTAHTLAARLRAAWERRHFRLVPHPFWNSSHFLWALPGDVLSALRGARLVVLKGDMNYRRAVGDALWPVATPFADVVGYLDAPVLALRSLKSDTLVGLSEDRATALDATDPAWRSSGQRGVIQAGNVLGG